MAHAVAEATAAVALVAVTTAVAVDGAADNCY
jgi:hypothetical protein